jgi:hypothetical protein
VARAVIVIDVPISETGGIRITCGTVNAIVPPAGEWRPEGEQVTGTFAGRQVAVQSAPRFAASPVTDAPKVTTAPAGTDAGKGGVMVIPVTVDVIVTVAATALLWSVVERAVSDTVPCAGTARGAVYVVVPPLAVCEGEKEPQLGGLPQIATQFTPALAMS